MFSLRAFGSMLTRVPFGLLSNRVPRVILVMIALACICGSCLRWACSGCPAMGALLVLEGIAFGLNLTVGQAAVIEAAGDNERGAAIGLHGTAGSLGSTVSPLVLGALANQVGIPLVFQITSAAALVALLLAWAVLSRGMLRAPNARV